MVTNDSKIESSPQSRLSRTKAVLSRPIEKIALFLTLFGFVIIPYFFNAYFLTSEEHVVLFQTVFDKQLFTPPGSNRFLAVLQFATSWAGDEQRAKILQFIVIAVSASTALTFFVYSLPRTMFFAGSWSLLLVIAIFFGGGLYQFHLGIASPYLLSFSIGIACCLLLINFRPKSLLAYNIYGLALFILIFSAAGINPTVSLQCIVFLALYFAFANSELVFGERSVVANLHQSQADRSALEKALALGIALNAFATTFIFWLQGWYKHNFPQNVKSNYSVESYLDSGLSLKEAVNAFRYAIEFHARSGLFGVEISAILIVLAFLSGFVSFSLWILRRQKQIILAELYFVAFLIWASAIIVILVSSQNAHIQIVPNMIRGRYFTTPYFSILLSLSLIIAAGTVDAWPKVLLIGRRYGCRGALLGGAALLAASTLFHQVTRQTPAARFEYALIDLRRPPIVRLAGNIQMHNVQAVLGNFWWLWSLQYEFNKTAVHSPRVTPVAIRSESFGLNAFRPIVDALIRTKRFKFACVERKNQPPGFEQKCEDQIATYQNQGAFPVGKIWKLSQYEFEEFIVTLYEQGLERPVDHAGCVASQVLFRATQRAFPNLKEQLYDLDDDSFVYIQASMTHASWTLLFENRSGKEVFSLPDESNKEVRLLGRTVRVVSSGCRLMVMLSRGDDLYPTVTRLIVK